MSKNSPFCLYAVFLSQIGVISLSRLLSPTGALSDAFVIFVLGRKGCQHKRPQSFCLYRGQHKAHKHLAQDLSFPATGPPNLGRFSEGFQKGSLKGSLKGS